MMAAAACAAALGAGGGFRLLAHPPTMYLLFAVLVMAGELFVLRLPARNDDVLLSASSVFAYATALLYGPGPAAVALGTAAIVKGGRDRRSLLKTGFNVAQHALTVGLAGLVYQGLGGSTGVPRATELPGALAGGLVYLTVNYILTGTVVALATGKPVRQQIAGEFGVWLPIEGAMLAFAPIVPIVAHRSMWMLPLLVLPFLGVAYSGRIAAEAEHAALHDALTGLPNRVLFRTRLEQALTRTQRSGSGLIVMVLDLDSFKDINDSLGHGRGDELLRALTARLKRALREADLVARLGGDEFGVLVSTAGPHQLAPDVLVERITDALKPPFQLGDLWVNARASGSPSPPTTAPTPSG
jgi:GGDEF domain-containing protein